MRHLSNPAHSSSSKQFLDDMDEFQQTIENWKEPVSCAFVVLMAHGEEGFLKGEDGNMVRLEDLFEVLNNKNCKALRGKPKVYIIQACRGGGDWDTLWLCSLSGGGALGLTVLCTISELSEVLS